jgi:hypothetical protein
MARLSKSQVRDHSNFQFKEEEVDLEELGGSVLVRAPSVKQREELSKHAPDKPEDWDLTNTARLFSVVVVDPECTYDEALEFLGDWPGTALDTVIGKFTQMIGDKEDLRDAAGEFPDKK